MWVVKLGGSLLSDYAPGQPPSMSPNPRDGTADSDLANWLAAIAGISEPIVVVPGGGPFADQVRHAQARWRLSDQAAHQMALLAMEQTARLFCDLQPRLPPLPHPQPGQNGVWLPCGDLLDDRSIAHSWDVTSDSLAALLAKRLDAQGLLLVKSIAPDAGPIAVSEATGGELLDTAFEATFRDMRCPAWIVSRGQSGALRSLIQAS